MPGLHQVLQHLPDSVVKLKISATKFNQNPIRTTKNKNGKLSLNYHIYWFGLYLEIEKLNPFSKIQSHLK